jgi:hypothetical protein
MAYPTGMLSFILEDIDRRASAVKLLAQQISSECAAGNVPSTRILDSYIRFKQERAQLATSASTPGLTQFARDQKNNQTLDVVVEFNAMIAAMDGITAWIETNYPKDVGGFLLAKQFSNGTIIDRMFTPAQTAGFQTQLNSLIATIN